MELCRKNIVPQIGAVVKGDGDIFKFGFVGLLNLAVGEGLAPPEIRKNIR